MVQKNVRQCRQMVVSKGAKTAPRLRETGKSYDAFSSSINGPGGSGRRPPIKSYPKVFSKTNSQHLIDSTQATNQSLLSPQMPNASITFSRLAQDNSLFEIRQARHDSRIFGSSPGDWGFLRLLNITVSASSLPRTPLTSFTCLWYEYVNNAIILKKLFRLCKDFSASPRKSQSTVSP